MSDAREWLAEALRTDDYGVLHDDPPQEWFIRANPDGGRRATIDALLAVLDECDKIKRTYDRGHPAVYDDFEAGLLTMMDNVVRAINKALEATDE